MIKINFEKKDEYQVHSLLDLCPGLTYMIKEIPDCVYYSTGRDCHYLISQDSVVSPEGYIAKTQKWTEKDSREIKFVDVEIVVKP